MNAAPANAAPIPDPNLNATPIAPRNNSGGTDAPPPSTFEGDDAPRYEPPSRTRVPENDPMADPMRDLGDPMFPPPRSRDLSPPSRTVPPAGGVDPLDDGFRSRPLPSRTPAPGTNPLDAPLDPASADPATGFSAGKAVVPDDGSVISTPAPADSAPIRDDAAPSSDASTEDQEKGTTNDAGPNLPAPSEGPRLDLSVTTRPVVVKARLTLQGRGSTMLHAERPRDDRQWSAIPAPLSVARQ